MYLFCFHYQHQFLQVFSCWWIPFSSLLLFIFIKRLFSDILKPFFLCLPWKCFQFLFNFSQFPELYFCNISFAVSCSSFDIISFHWFITMFMYCKLKNKYQWLYYIYLQYDEQSLSCIIKAHATKKVQIFVMKRGKINFTWNIVIYIRQTVDSRPTWNTRKASLW